MAYADKATTVSVGYDILPVLLMIVLNVLGFLNRKLSENSIGSPLSSVCLKSIFKQVFPLQNICYIIVTADRVEFWMLIVI